MHRSFRLSSYAVSSLAIIGALVGCGTSSEEESAPNPPPSEAVVFDASSDTKRELGIEKWGFETADDGSFAKYRGYGAKNEVLTEVVQKTDRTEPNKVVFTMAASGAKGAAKETIEFEVRPAANGTDAEVQMTVKENTFNEGDGPSKVLARFGVDAKAYASADLGAASSLVGNGGDQLVDRCKELTTRCNRLLIRDEIAAAGASSECGLLKRIGVPVLGGLIGAGAGALAGAGVGALPGAGIGVISGMGTQELLCFDARRGAAQARQDFQQCQQQQRAAGCEVTR